MPSLFGTLTALAILILGFSSSPYAQPGWPLQVDAGWQEAVLSVSDATQWQTQLQDIAGWQPILSGDVDRQQLALWGLDGDVSARFIVLQNPGETQGLVRLVQFSGAEQVQIRSSAQSWDTGGFLSLLLRSRGVDQNFADARRYQWTGYNDPVTLYLGPERRLRNVVLRGPDGINFGVYERVVPGLDGWPNIKKMSRPFNAMQIVKDRDATVAFYEDILGFVSMSIGNAPAAQADANNFGLPTNLVTSTPLKSAIMHPIGGESGRVEFVEWDGLEGRDLTDRAVAPNLGILTLRFPVANAEKRAKNIKDNGGHVSGPPVIVSMPPYGDVKMFSVTTPDGVFLEMFQPL
ncbi:MAG: hypothetical protein RIF37_15535 [Rhodospirillaceae bacterium]